MSEDIELANSDVVHIVLRNGNIDEVFHCLTAAEHHAKMLNKKWSLTKVITKEVKFI